MKVLDLQCEFAHSFEGWFGSEDDFQSQLSRGLVQCPMCDSAKITKKLSAPRLNLGATPSASDVQQSAIATNTVANSSVNTTATAQNQAHHLPVQAQRAIDQVMGNPEFQKAYLEMAKQVLKNTDDVGKDFAREARKIHYGEAPQRGIRGEASKDDVMELLDEGIEVMPLALPKALKGTLQ
jgi:hypothetical protein